MIEALYRELGPSEKERFDEHLRSCPECASEYSVLGATLSVMDRRERPDPGPEFWSGYWDRLAARLEREGTVKAPGPSLGARLGRAFSRLPRWSYQAAGAVALLLVGIVIGSRLINTPGGTGPVTKAAVSAQAGAVVNAENFIDRSKVLLLGLVNYNPATEDAYAFDLGRKKTMSRVLAAEAPALRNALTERGQRRLRGLVADLEVIMMQIANLESGQDLEGVELIKQGVDRRGIFLKIDLDRMARDARGETKHAPSPVEAAFPKKKKT
jgi:hypothetical protein